MRFHITSLPVLILATVVAAAVPYVAVGIFDSSLYHVMDLSSYLIFHNITEFYSIIVSFSIFGLGWYTYEQNNDRQSLFLSMVFFGIGMMDFMHTLGYTGMPSFITPNDTNKATLFWISVRLFSAAAFLASSYISAENNSPWLSKLSLLTISVFVSCTVFVIVIFFHKHLPPAFIQGVGLTPFKKNTEYLIILLLLLASIRYGRLLSVSGTRQIRCYLVAFILCIYSELTFTLYKSAFDTYNMLGHIYKTIAFMLIYKGIFVAAIRKPYEDLRKKSNMLSHIMNSIPQAIFWKDRDCLYLGCNHVFAQLAGLKNPGDIVGLSDFELPWGHEASKGYRADDQEVMGSKKAKVHFIERLNRVNGETVLIDTTKIPLLDAGSEVEGVLGVFDDVTERVQADIGLKEALLFNQQIIECAQEGIIVYDTDLRYRVWNPFMEKITGITATEVSGRTPLDVFPFLKDAGVIERLNGILEGGQIKPVEFRYDIPATGMSGWVVDTSAPLFNATGETIGIIGIVRDITGSKAIEEQLQQSRKIESIGRLAGGIAHDFNNMLSVILGNAELSLMELDPSSRVYKRLMEIQDGAEKSAALTRQLLAFARKQSVSPKVVDLNEAISRMLKILKRLIGEDIDLKLHAASNLWLVKIDPSQVDQILANLCVNARDAIHGIGNISIETDNYFAEASYCEINPDARPGEYVRITVRDDGTGMDKETVSHIFEPFYSTKGDDKGTGLGLATVYGAVVQNNGFINVWSEVDKGTVFTVHLPRHHYVEDLTAKRSEPKVSPAKHETILLVEDEAAILDMAFSMLTEIGYNILRAGSPAEAIQLADGHTGEIHMMLTDVIMPGMNGKDLADRIQQQYPALKCLFMSGYTADIIANQGVISEGTHFIQKPFSVKALASKIRSVLDDSDTA